MMINYIKFVRRRMIPVRRVLQAAFNYWSALHVRSACERVGHELEVLGSVKIYGDGQFLLGNKVCLRSRSHNTIEMFSGVNARLIIGDQVFVNQGTRIICTKHIAIGNNCLIGDECLLIDNDYHTISTRPVRQEPIILEDNVWLASRVIILRGVTIGRGSVIGAGAVVTRSIPQYSFAVGAPAKVFKTIPETSR
ncbi:MAG: acyltransferase [Oscillochloridaceae bacterium umkhey_bin13]